MRRRIATAAAAVLAPVVLTGCASGMASTTPAAPAPAGLWFAVKGDWGYGGTDQAAVTSRMCAENAVSPFAFVLTVGDNFYNPDGMATAANFTKREACLLRAGVTWYAAWGNHDEGRTGTATALHTPRHWYTFARGPVRVIVLDANQTTSTAQRRFLATTLKRSTQPMRIVAFHQPAYTMGLHAPNTDAQRLWVPLFRRYGVALVLSGHNHAYERMVVNGVTYITTGGGGAPLYPCIRPAPGAKKCTSEYEFLTISATGASATVRAERPDGTLIERVVVPARS
ncbi:MAG: metallophosphoesterase [Thermoleophilia bacterium]